MAQDLPPSYRIGALYVAGFTQAQAPHLGLLLATTNDKGILFHIRVDRTTSPNWQFQRRSQPVAEDMFLSSLLCISKGPWNSGESIGVIDSLARSLPLPDHGEFGHCAPWVFDFVELLSANGLCTLMSKDDLADEVRRFARESNAYARRDRFPNVADSKFCS
ncbi:hypothetical protein C8F01DRAFT_1107397 [Mycena amicta]|nr:hypothetical protein C8F01DRAFT_1107397 [Mycena amicta]